MIEINLSPSELIMGALAGVMRNVQCLKHGLESRYADPGSALWQNHIEGALGEMALCKYLDHYWSGKGIMRGDDAGPYQVRATKYHNGHLILHDEDEDQRIYWHITGGYGKYRIHGWITGAKGKDRRFWKDHASNGRPAYFVPTSALSPPEAERRITP